MFVRSKIILPQISMVSVTGRKQPSNLYPIGITDSCIPRSCKMLHELPVG
uniref:Uncharacterized protein n=1 Tax=Rhizobium rhizogenes TaxID=359 RepID=A0A7S4ZRR4_RHIRH|nr:hypothetical protein pC5.8a_216 [Rhizobium rhizogenes]